MLCNVKNVMYWMLSIAVAAGRNLAIFEPSWTFQIFLNFLEPSWIFFIFSKPSWNILKIIDPFFNLLISSWISWTIGKFMYPWGSFLIKKAGNLGIGQKSFSWKKFKIRGGGGVCSSKHGQIYLYFTHIEIQQWKFYQILKILN